jgi:hypothetical protein
VLTSVLLGLGLVSQVALRCPEGIEHPACAAVAEEKGRLAHLHGLASQGRVPARPRWSREAHDPFAWRTEPARTAVGLFPLSVPQPELWAAVAERSLLFAVCNCDAESLPGRLENAPLRVSKVTPPNVMLTWTSSCSPGAEDYGVYQGSVGSFASHTAAACSTGGSTAWTLTPGSGNRYFLVVPLSATEEGSYGNRSDGSERPTAPGPCRAGQRISVCP